MFEQYDLEPAPLGQPLTVLISTYLRASFHNSIPSVRRVTNLRKRIAQIHCQGYHPEWPNRGELGRRIVNGHLYRSRTNWSAHRKGIVVMPMDLIDVLSIGQRRFDKRLVSERL